MQKYSKIGIALRVVFKTIHERNTSAMQSAIAPYGITLNCITDEKLLEILVSRSREIIKIAWEKLKIDIE